MTTPSRAARTGGTAFIALLAVLLVAGAPQASAQTGSSGWVTGPPPTSFAEASQLFRAGRHAAAFGRFSRLANEGDREAARVALVMHRHGATLFGSAWDATTEELVQWSVLAQAADRAEIAARHRIAARAVPVGGTPGEAANIATETFRGSRRKRP